MNHKRIGEISAEMSGLIEQQTRILKDTSIASLSQEDLDAYADRNERLRDLCIQLMKLT